jgi:hypothetical protein
MWPLAVIRALRFRNRQVQELRALAQTSWRSLIEHTDEAHITLPLATRCRDLFPRDAQRHLDAVLTRNAVRQDRIIEAYNEIAASLGEHGIEFAVLKGFTQWPWYADDPAHRYQSDLDIYCPCESLQAAAGALAGLGYEPYRKTNAPATDHLPTHVRKTGWTWNGDYYDPDRPPYVEIHFRFWDPATEGFSAGDTEAFWTRREVRDSIPSLSVRDTLSYSALHLVRHLLRGDLKVRHVYELAHFLERSPDSFWARAEPDPALRLIEGIAFRLAAEWFECKLPRSARRIVDQLPEGVDRWFRLFCFSPATGIVSPNKDELWLHCSLVEDPAVRRRIAVRRLMPVRRQRVLLDAQLPGTAGILLTTRRAVYEASFLTRRALHHMRTVRPLLRSAFRWGRATALLP